MADDTKVDLNTATADELVQLPGIGATLAERILARRNEVGRFTSIDDLLTIDGFSERVLAAVSDRVSVGPTATIPTSPSLVVVLVGGSDYTGYTVSVDGLRFVDDVAVPFGASSATTAGGEAEVRVPSRASLIGEVTIRAISPDGTVLASRTEEARTLPGRVTIEVAPQDFPTTQPNDDPTAGRPTRLRGRVIDEAGARIPAGIQVVVWGTSIAEPADADFRALVVAETDARGHFTGPYPIGSFSAAHATVAIDDPAVGVPVHLVPATSGDDVPADTFPESVVLVVDLTGTDLDLDDEDDCACHDPGGVPRGPDGSELARADGTFSSDPGAGRCVDFTKPDRTLEEFTYSYAVRTTEPEIRGLTLDEPAKIGIGTLAPHLEILTAIGRRDVVTTDQPTLSRDVDAAVSATAATIPDDYRLDAKALKTLARDPDGFSLATVAGAVKLTAHADLLRAVGALVPPPPRRTRLTCDNPVDWDDDPTVYQACSIAHGHLLRFKQEWVADGYSMGNLLYSLPLAPGQKKRIAVVDWERRESSSRTEARDVSESLEALVDRDRDINEIVSGTLTESVRGGSKSSSGSFAGGLGIGAIIPPVGGLLGIGGGSSSASSSAWQNSSRNTSASALNQLRDRTIQSASSLRSQRSSVVQTVRQGERVTATTETVANYNHCHAITIQYFEVLRHLLVRQRLVDVQECLFVPLLMSYFTRAKAARWRHTLHSSVPRQLRAGFDAIDRIANGYAGSDLPLGRYADENLLTVDGDLRLRFQLTRPRDDDDGEFDAGAWSPLLKLFGFDPADFYEQFLKGQALKDRIFLERLGPRIAENLVSVLRISVLKTDGSAVDLRIDPTLISDFVNDRNLYVSLRMSADLAPVDRADIKAIVIEGKLELPGLPVTIDVLPAGSRVIVESLTMRYSTAHHSDFLVHDNRVRNDLTGDDDVRIETPLNRRELRNPREEDKERTRDLLDHLNEHLERYHHVIWAKMSPDRRFMLLDGFEAPNSGGRSVASVVDNELVGIVGNCLVMPVSRGVHLDPTFNQDVEQPIDLLEHYEPNTPIEPSRVAIPTRGVYAEAVMGACNSCEVKEEERFWRWEESPIPDDAPQILPVSTDSRRAAPGELTAGDFPAPLIALQNAPAAPDPTGLTGALSLLGQSGVFRDITGLEGTQRNAAAALSSAFDTATTFGTKAADLALQGKMSKDIDKAIKTIDSAKAQGLISEEQARQLSETAIRGMIGGGATNPPNSTTTPEVKEITETAGKHDAAVSVTRPTGEKVEVDARSSRDSDRSFIIERSGNEPEARAFGPATNDKRGVTSMSVTVPRLPSGGTIRWSVPPDQHGRIDVSGSASAVGEQVTVRGLRSGLAAVDVAALDATGSPVESIKFRLSVPQFVTVDEEKAAFEQSLTDFGVLHLEDDILAEARRTSEHLLRKANVRMIWRVGASPAETLPPHVAGGEVIALTLRGEPPLQPDGSPSGLEGRTDHGSGVIGTTVANETISVWPGAFDNVIPGDPTFVDVETNALVIQLASQTVSDPVMEGFAVKVIGRLIGEVMAHEIVHALIGTVHLPVATDVNSLMEVGGNRSFRQRTGLEDTAHTSPVDPANFVDHGIAAIGGIGVTNQALIDANFPVPPAFG